MFLSLTKKICEDFVKKGLLEKEDLVTALKVLSEKGGNLAEILVKTKVITKENILVGLSSYFDIPPIRLSKIKIDSEILSLIPKRTSIEYKVLPVSRIGKYLTVAMVDPMNIFVSDDIRIMTRLNILPVITSEDEMNEAISNYYEKSANEEISEIVDDIKSSQMEMVGDDDDNYSSGELLKVTEEAPVVKMTNMILGRGVKERASDILIEPLETKSRVRYRIDGVLFEKYMPPKKMHQALISRLKVMSDLDIAERRLPQDGRFRIKLDDRKVDFRISVIPSSYGEKAALRILDKNQAMINLDSLGIKKRDIEKIQDSAKKPHGMILICGPTGCGKTTSLYSVLNYVDDPGKNIITVEDPIEYEMKGINQVSVNEDVGLTFSSCLRSILRQDPDVIMVGEIRDFETIDIAIKSALTGHMVLSTLHTNSASGSIVRMINMGVEPFLIAASVEFIGAQRLVRKLCTDCREGYIPTQEVAEKYKLFNKEGKIATLYKPIGCKRCINSGYRGRIAIVECMPMSSAIKDMIFKRAQATEIEKVARQEGMVTLRENGIENVVEGITSLEDVLRVTAETKDLE